MKKIIKKIMVFVLTVLLVLPSMNAVGALSSHFLNAKEINIEQTYSGKVRAASSEYFKFNTEETGIVTFDYTYTDNDYSKVHLYDSEGEELFFSFSIRVNENGVAHVIYKFNLNAGQYYIKIRNTGLDVYEDHRYDGNYSFKTTFEKSNESFKESSVPNDNTLETSNKINLDTTYKGFLSFTDNCDYYTFDIDKDMSVDIKYDCYFNTSTIMILDSKGNKLWSDEYLYVGDNDINETTGKYSGNGTVQLKKGKYYLKFNSYTTGESDTGIYDFKLSRALPFTDVYEGNWYYGAVANAYYGGLMTGATETLFKPNNNMNRGMVAIVFHRMEGAPKVNYSAVFPDVYNNQYYTTAVIWAKQKGVINGYNNGTFMPLKNVTREEMATMIYRFAKYKGVNVKATKDISYFSDYKNITTYAKEPLQWCVEKGIMSGKLNGTKLDPLGNATRAECSKMLVQANQVIYQ